MAKPKRIDKPSEGNPNWPMPADYMELTRDGQRQARCNACRQWQLPGTPQERGINFAASVRWFDLYYLHPDPAVEFDPMFYDEAPLSKAGFHDDILHQWGSSDRNIAIAPRGAAKSVLCRKAMLLRLLSRPIFSIVYATSTTDNAKAAGIALKHQFQENERIADDWGPECPDGRLIPRRGEAPFGLDFLVLKNGSSFRAVSAESRLRGGRPRRFTLDDPEFDPKASTSMALLRQYMETFLFKVVLPMVMRPGCGVDWLATFVSRRHYAWHAMQTVKGPHGNDMALDPRFELWSRLTVRAAVEVDDPATGGKKLASCWPEMWPTEEEKKARPELAGRYTLEDIRSQVGTANFLSEYMAKPGAPQDAYFGLLSPEKHGYEYSQPDELLEKNPRQSLTQVTYWEGNQKITQTLKELLGEMRLFQTVDTSYTSGTDSDYKATAVMGVDKNGNLWVLDAWAKQTVEGDLVRNVLEKADRWRVPAVWPECIKEGISIFFALDAVVKARAKELVGVTHLPAIRKILPGQQRKVDKIAALGMRFEHGKIKLPLAWRQVHPWRLLFDQIDEFNPEAEDGGLKHDDILDCIAMSMFIVTGRHQYIQKDEKPKTPLELLKEGTFKTASGYTIQGMNFNEIPVQDLMEIMALKPPPQLGGTRA